MAVGLLRNVGCYWLLLVVGSEPDQHSFRLASSVPSHQILSFRGSVIDCSDISYS